MVSRALFPKTNLTNTMTDEQLPQPMAALRRMARTGTQVSNNHPPPPGQGGPCTHLAVDTVRVIALRALGTGKEVALCPPAKAATYHTHVLGKHTWKARCPTQYPQHHPVPVTDDNTHLRGGRQRTKSLSPALAHESHHRALLLPSLLISSYFEMIQPDMSKGNEKFKTDG